MELHCHLAPWHRLAGTNGWDFGISNRNLIRERQGRESFNEMRTMWVVTPGNVSGIAYELNRESRTPVLNQKIHPGGKWPRSVITTVVHTIWNASSRDALKGKWKTTKQSIARKRPIRTAHWAVTKFLNALLKRRNNIDWMRSVQNRRWENEWRR